MIRRLVMLPVALVVFMGLLVQTDTGIAEVKNSSAVDHDKYKIVSTLKHRDLNLECIHCHGVVDNPTKMPPSSACVNCHNSGNGWYFGILDENGNGITKTYLNFGEPREVAIHDSHRGPVRCTICHTVHKKPSEKIHCNWCHQLDVKVK